MGYLMPNLSFVEEKQWYYLTHSWVDKEAHTFSNGISSKVNNMIEVWIHSLCGSNPAL